jgi:hypothetical protein
MLAGLQLYVELFLRSYISTGLSKAIKMNIAVDGYKDVTAHIHIGAYTCKNRYGSIHA